MIFRESEQIRDLGLELGRFSCDMRLNLGIETGWIGASILLLYVRKKVRDEPGPLRTIRANNNPIQEIRVVLGKSRRMEIQEDARFSPVSAS